MAKNSYSSSISQKRKPRLLWANPYCLLDTSSGASMAVRQMLHQLVQHDYDVQVLGCTIFDSPKGMGQLKEQYPDLRPHLHQLIEAEDGALSHQLVVTARTIRNHLTAHEEGLWYSQYLYLLDSFKPDIVWYYGGQTLDLLIANEARVRGIPSAFYLANGNYKAVRWCQDVDLILTDSQATAEMYRKEIGYIAKPIGSFLDPSLFVAENHERKRLLFVNPSWQKGASVVVQLSLALEKQRPDIQLEVVEARADWSAVLRETTRKLGEERASLSNVIVTPNTNDMRGPYSRARLLLAPSLWWESSGRVLAEAMLNGIPALITNRGGMPEMIDDAGVAFDFPQECYEAPYRHLLDDEQLQPLIDAVLNFYDDEALYAQYVQRAWETGKRHHHIDKSTERLLNAFAPLIKLKAGNKDFIAPQQKRHRQGLATIYTQPEFEVDASLLAQNQSPGHSEQNKPLPTGDFDWQLQGKVIILDSRAKLLKMGVAENFTKTGAFGIIAFDPASEVSDPKQYEGSETIQVFQHALLGDGNPATLYACLETGMSSTLEPLPQEVLPERHHQGATVLTRLPISTIALDSIEGLPSIDWLILDELSDVAAILEHGRQALKEALLIQARVAFQPTHKHQPSLAELHHWASRNGFRFYRFNDIQHYSHLPAQLREHRDCATDQESAEVLFLPNHERMADLNNQSKIKLAFILSTNFGAHDIAYELIASMDQEGASKFLEATGFLPRSSKRDGAKTTSSGVEKRANNLKVQHTREVVRLRDFLYEEARKKLSNFLNDHHGLDKSERFWDICLHYFLGQSFISSYLARWNNGLLNSRPSNDITSHFPCSELIELDWKAYAKHENNSPFFDSHFGGLEDSPSRTLSYRPELSSNSILPIRQYLNKVLPGVKKYAFDLGSHRHDYWKEDSAKKGVKLLRLSPFWIENSKNVDFKARAMIAELDKTSPLEDFRGFWSSLALSLPAELLELFPELLKKCESITKKYSPEFILSTQLANVTNRILSALFSEKGVPLHLQQHGGAYGEYPSHIGVCEVRISDIFYTWNWGQGHKKLRPAPPHRLELLENEYNKIKDHVEKTDILVIGPHRPLVPTLFEGTDKDPSADDELFKFLKTSASSSKGNVVFRFRRQHGYDSAYEEKVIKSLPKGALIDDQKRSIVEAYAKAKKVVIVDPFTTSALECEHLGIPYQVLGCPGEEFMKIPSFLPKGYE